jgi:hypothetical protein
MTETPGRYDIGDRTRPQPPPSFEAQLKALPPAVRSVAESWHCEIWKGQSVMSRSTLQAGARQGVRIKK